METRIEEKCRTCGGSGVLYRCHDAIFGCYGHFIGLDREAVACNDCQGTGVLAVRPSSPEEQTAPPERQGVLSY